MGCTSSIELTKTSTQRVREVVRNSILLSSGHNDEIIIENI